MELTRPQPPSGRRIQAKTRYTVMALAHGDLHAGNVLVERDARAAWLIDFARSGWGHWARDFTELEASIKFQHLAAPKHGRRFEFEAALSGMSRLSEMPDVEPEDDSEHKLLNVVHTIRACAGRASAGVLDEETAAEDYQLSLYCTTVNLFRFHRLLRDRTRKHQIQMSAALLRERLSEGLASG